MRHALLASLSSVRAAAALGAAMTLSAAMGTIALPQAAGAATLAGHAAGRARAAAGGSQHPAVNAASPGLFTVGTHGWEVQSSASRTGWTTGHGATQSGNQISEPGFRPSGWLPVRPDDAGAPGTEVEALLQHGSCPDDRSLQPVDQSAYSPHSIFYSDNMVRCFGPAQTIIGPDAHPMFAVPWWFRTDFDPGLRPGQDARLVINGVVGQADVWVNGTEVATEATVEGDYTSYTFDVTGLIRPGTNSLALELYPNNPNTMLTLDDVDWEQMPPDNNTGIQFPVQLHISDALAISDTYVTQNDAADMSSAALTVHADITNNTAAAQSGNVTADIAPPGGGAPIGVSQPVTLAAGASATVTFAPSGYPQLVVDQPRLWWPYQMGGQPLYTLSAAVSAGGQVSDAAPRVSFGIRSVASYLTAPSVLAPEGVRVFEVNGVPFDFRGGGWSENLFLHYSAADLANQITLMKSMGVNAVRTEGKQMPQNFYDQMDRAGILIDAGFQCCDKWQPPYGGRTVTAQDYHVMYLSSLTIGEQLRDHPSVLNFAWSDSQPINEQEIGSLAGLSQSGFQGPIVSSAEYNQSAILGPSGEKEGPYDWVPPSYWYDTTHSSNNATDDDSTLTDVGGSWGFDSEQSAGATVPTMDSIRRFLSPADQAALWKEPHAHQYHLNYESSDGQHSGYAFGTLLNLDTAIAHRYGGWHSLAGYVEEAQLQNYEDVRAQFEAYIDHWDHFPTPATGTDYWMMNKGWPSMLWDLYNYDYDEAGSYFGAKKANEDLHVLYALDTGKVAVDNLTGVSQPGLTVQARVYDLDGKVSSEETTAHAITLAPQQVRNAVLTPRVPAATRPPEPAQTYFVELILRQHGVVVDRNVYWQSTQPDVIDWKTTEGPPQADNGAPLSQYENMTALHQLPRESVRVAADTRAKAGPDGDNLRTYVTITNPASNRAVAFFLRADVRRGSSSGAGRSGLGEVVPITWSDNDITLWPGQSETLVAAYRSSLLQGRAPVVTVYGWNVPDAGFAAPRSAAAARAVSDAQDAPHVQHFGIADGTPLVGGTARPGSTRPGSGPAAKPAASAGHQRGPKWTIRAVAHSARTVPSTSFTQGEKADSYRLTLTNTGGAATDGSTPVTLTDVIDPGLQLAAAAGRGWTCRSSDTPTIVCRETGGRHGQPAVLRPGQSYPPVTVRVRVPLGAGFGTQGSTAGLHATNAVFAAGGARSRPSASVAEVTPIAGVPDLTADNALDGAFRQGDSGDRYEITVMNVGAAATNGSPSDPITATVTAVPAGETITALYGSGWTCSLGGSPGPADSCHRSDVLAGENGEEPPITVVVRVTNNAPDAGNETVQVSGGGDAAAPAVVTAPTTILRAADLHAASRQADSFTQGDRADRYTLTISNVRGPNAPAGGPSLGLVWLSDRLPGGLTARAISGPGWSCDLAAVSCYRVDALSPGASYPPVTLTVSVAADAAALVVNAVRVAGGGMTYGPHSSTSAGGQTGTDRTKVKQKEPTGALPPPPARPKLTVASTHTGSFAQGDTADLYTLSVSDAASDGPATGMITVTDTLPAGMVAVQMAGAGWHCSLAPATLPPAPRPRHNIPNTFESQTVCYRFGPLAPGASAPPINLRVAVDDNAQPALSNTVIVSADGERQTGTDPTAVRQLPALAISSYPSAGGIAFAPFAVGSRDLYNVSVANDGYAPTTGRVSFQLNVPAGLTAQSITAGSGWQCSLTQAACWTLPGVSIAAGQRDPITVQVTVDSGAPPSVQTLMQASGGGEIGAPSIDLDNDYSIVSNGGEFTDPTYIRLGQ
jgi:exo-1,4-beta-D-glucosaminidase